MVIEKNISTNVIIKSEDCQNEVIEMAGDMLQEMQMVIQWNHCYITIV